ncbi:hypothetical protein OSB04_029308 [Centaurea solstitialis]|uniref:Retrotransposon gag domain-containing protein n=1 Tax=Centaurea solstitialis TaxID=347529 RepID=A0AA38T0Y3_9ASTR|nr:hypothetical protein OSB04_029308 [Centaurea solstitialis]
MHKSKDYSLDDLLKHLRIEEETRNREKRGKSLANVHIMQASSKGKGRFKSTRPTKTWKLGPRKNLSKGRVNPRRKSGTSRIANVVVEIEDLVENLSMEEIDLLAMNEYVVLATKGGWYFDTGAMVHVCNSRDNYVEYHEVHDGKQVTMVNKNRTHIAASDYREQNRAHVAGIRTFQLHFTSGNILTLMNVLHVPTIAKCMLSYNKLDINGFGIRGGDSVIVFVKEDGFILNNLTAISEGLVELFVEPERELRKTNKKKSKACKVRTRALKFEMGEEAPMWNTRRTAPTVPTKPITKPNLETEIKGQFLHMIKELTFDGKSDSNPIVHIESFKEICDLFKTENNRDAIRLRLFPFTLTGEAKAWLRSLEPSSIATWEDLRSKFLSRFFPPSKIKKLRAEIRSFRQEDEGTISEAWERFKHLLNSCPSHGLNNSDQVQTFYSGLNYSSRGTLDSSAGGVFMYKTPTQGYNLLEDMLIHNIDWKSDKRLQTPKLVGKISTEFDPSEELAAMKNKQIGRLRQVNQPPLPFTLVTRRDVVRLPVSVLIVVSVIIGNINEVYFNYSMCSISLWHKRLAHTNIKNIRKCNIKFTKKPFPLVKRGTSNLELIYFDIFDLNGILTRGGKRYFITFYDDFSRFLHVYLLHSKEEAFEYFKHYKLKSKNKRKSKSKY